MATTPLATVEIASFRSHSPAPSPKHPDEEGSMTTRTPTNQAAVLDIEELHFNTLSGMEDKDHWEQKCGAEAVEVENAEDEEQKLQADAAADDETEVQQRAREEREAKAAKIRKDLAGEYAVAVYRWIACRSKNLTHVEFRVLNAYLDFSNKLTNCFPGRKKVLAKVGGSVGGFKALGKTRLHLLRKGWMKGVPLNEGDRVAPEGEDDDGLLERANETGRFGSATGYVFRIPPGEIAPGDPGWKGPHKFDRRVWGKRRSQCLRKR